MGIPLGTTEFLIPVYRVEVSCDYKLYEDAAGTFKNDKIYVKLVWLLTLKSTAGP